MNYLSIIYSSISLVIIIVSIIIIIVKQWSLKSTPVYYFLGLEVLIGLWILAGLFQTIFSNPIDVKISYYFIVIGVIANGLAMICNVLFASSLSGQIPLKRVTLYVVFLVIGGVFALTLSPDVFSVVYDADLDLTKASANIVWIICLASSVILSGTYFLTHLIRQLSIIDEKYKKSTNFLIAGVIIAFFVSIGIYVLRFIVLFQKAFLHAELVSTSIGAGLLANTDILENKNFTGGGGELPESWQKNFTEGNYVKEDVVVDGNVITAKGVAVAKFAVTIGKQLGIFSCKEDEKREYEMIQKIR
ncbi:MAG: hypothetical protein HZR80_08145 [Candidatus Heimdallarchaeota archaeon]